MAGLRAGCNVIWVPGGEVSEVAGVGDIVKVIEEQGCEQEVPAESFVLKLGSLSELLMKIQPYQI